MKRSDYTGFTLDVFGYSIEFVSCNHKPVIIAIYKNHNRELVKRFGR